MSQTVVPMIHVPDVRATLDWYTSIGFKLVRQNEEDGEINWAKLTFGISEVMFQSGGKSSTEHRREVDLYITTENVDQLYRRLKARTSISCTDASRTGFKSWWTSMMLSTACVSSLFVTSTDSGSPSGNPHKRSRSAAARRAES